MNSKQTGVTDAAGVTAECAGLRPLMSDYIDGLLDAHTRAKLEEHIVVCDNCPTLFKAMLASYQALQADTGTQVPDETRMRLRERLLKALDETAP
jgi:anti-sigma factor RsiW